MEHLVLGEEHGCAHGQSRQLGGGDGQPDAVDAQQQRQQENGDHLKYQRAQKGDQRAGHAVAQRREKGGRIHVEAHDEEAQRIQPEGTAGQGQQLRIVAHENARYTGDDEHGSQRQGHSHHGDEPQAFPVEVVHLGVVAGTVVEADDGCTAHGIALEHRHEQEGRGHDDAVGGHAVLTGQTQQLVVVQDIDQRHGKVGHQLGRAVDAGIPQDFAVKTGLAQVQAAGVAAVDEVEHRQYAAHQLADKGGNGSALHAPAPDAHHQHIQHYVGAACAHGEPEAEVRLFGGDKNALEHILQRKGRQSQHQDAPVAHRIVQKLPLCAQQHGNGPQEHNAQHGQHTDRDQSRQQEQGKIAVGLFLVALAQRDAHDGAAAGAQHKADGAQQHGQRYDEVDRRKGRLAHKVGDTQAVHDAVDGGEQRGADAGQHEPQKAEIGKMIGKLDTLLGHGVLLSAQGAKNGSDKCP